MSRVSSFGAGLLVGLTWWIGAALLFVAVERTYRCIKEARVVVRRRKERRAKAAQVAREARAERHRADEEIRRLERLLELPARKGRVA